MLQSLEVKAQGFSDYNKYESEKSLKEIKKMKNAGISMRCAGIVSTISGIVIVTYAGLGSMVHLFCNSFFEAMGAEEKRYPRSFCYAFIGGGLLTFAGITLWTTGHSHVKKYDEILKQKKSTLQMGMTSHGIGLRFHF